MIECDKRTMKELEKTTAMSERIRGIKRSIALVLMLIKSGLPDLEG